MGNTSAKCKKILKKYWITFKKNEKSLDNSSIRCVFTLFDNDNDGKLNKLEAREYVSYLIDISGIKLQLIDATPYGMSFIQYYEQFINEVVAYLSVGSGKEEGIDMQQLIKQYTNHKLFPLLRFLSQKGWQLHLTRQNLQESSLHEKPQYSVRSERDNSEIEFEFEPDISFQENSLLDLTQEDSLSTGETSEIEINANHVKEEFFPTVNIKVKLPSGDVKILENIKANVSLVDLKKMCVDSSIVTELCFYYGNELLNEVDVPNSFPLKVVGHGEHKEDERVSITEKMSTSDFKNRLLRTKKNKNQRVKGSKVRAGDITISLEGTLIIPSDGKSYHSPPNLGQIEMFDLAKNELKNDSLNWKKSFSENSSCNKVFLAPLHSHKAFWINFDSTKRYAVKARVGELNIINGKPWKDGVLEKSTNSQNYFVLPQQSFLEGANFGSTFLSQFTFENLCDKKHNSFPAGRILLEFHPENTMDLQIYNSLCLHSPPLDPNKSMSDLSIKKGDYVYMRSTSFGKRSAQICDVIDFSKDQDIFLTLKVTKILILVKPTVNVFKTKGPKGTIPISVDLNQPISNLLKFVKESKQFCAPQLNESKDFKFEYKYRFVFKDKELSNNAILYDCGVKEKDVLEMRVELTSVPQSKPSRKRFDSSFNFENSTFEEDLSETSSFVDISENDEIPIKSNISRKEIIGGQIKQTFVRDESNIKWNSDAAFTVELQIVDPSEFLKKTGKKVDSHISSKTYEMYGFPSSLVKFESK